MKKVIFILIASLSLAACQKQDFINPKIQKEGKKKKRNPADSCIGCQPICLNPPFCDSVPGGSPVRNDVWMGALPRPKDNGN